MTTTSLRRVKVAPKGMGLNDFVAMQEGFFAAEGLDVEFDWKTFRGTQSSWKGLDYFQRPQDRPYTERKQDVVQGACVWGTICNASAGMGRVVTEGYGDSPWAIFVRPDSKIRKPEDLEGRADLGRHARGQPLQRALPAGKISAARTHQDRQYRRLRRAAARRCSMAKWRPRACCHRRSRWPSNSACATSSRTLQDAVVGAGKLRPAKWCTATARARSRRTGPGRQTSRNICPCGSSLFRLSSRLSPLGLHQVRPRRELRLRTAAERRIRRRVHASATLGTGCISQRSQH